jgi:hypothetical protein
MSDIFMKATKTVKVQFTLQQDTKAQARSKSRALCILELQRQMVIAMHRPLCARERDDTRCTGGWVGPRASLDGCRKSRLHRDYIS